MDLSVVIVNYNYQEGIIQTLRSVFNSETKYSFEVILVDNGSVDASVALIKNTFGNEILSGSLNIIEVGENIGFGKGCNLGIQNMRGNDLLLLNPDARVSVDTVEVMLSFIRDRKDVGIAVCKVFKADGSIDLASRRNIPTLRDAIFRASGLSKIFFKSSFFNRYNMADRSLEDSHEIGQCNGAFMMISAACLEKVKGFDDRFFMYFEDSDLCIRAKEAGFKIWYHPKTSIIHLKSQIASKNYNKNLRLFHRSMKLFVAKHYHFWRPILFLIYLGIDLRMYVLLIKKHFHSRAVVSK